MRNVIIRGPRAQRVPRAHRVRKGLKVREALRGLRVLKVRQPSSRQVET